MKAYRLMAPQRAELTDIPQPQPGPSEILVKIAGCGLCHSDIGIIAMDDPAALFGSGPPFTLGHEITGWIAGFGPNTNGRAHGLKEGDAVCVYPQWGGCGTCTMCREGHENFCAFSKPVGPGSGLDGGLTEYLVAPDAKFLLPLGSLDPVAAAPLTDAALTAYTALKRNLPFLRPGDPVLVMGVGGVGLTAVQLLHGLSGARIIAVDTKPARLSLAREHGADDTLVSDDTLAERVRDLTGGVGAALIVDGVGTSEMMALAMTMLARCGRYVVIGAQGGTVPFGLFTVPFGAQLMTTIVGGTVELREVITLAQLGRLPPLIDRYALSDLHKGYAAMEAGTLQGRAVCVPD